MIQIIIDIVIRDNTTGKYLVVPVTPPSIDYASGDAIVNTVNVLGLGDIDIPNGVGVDAISWASFLPGRYDAAYCSVKALKRPTEYQSLFNSWKAAGTSLQLIIPALDVNKTVYVASFTTKLSGFEGDLEYGITLKELKNLKPKQIATAVKTISWVNTLTQADRAPAAAKKDDYTINGTTKGVDANSWLWIRSGPGTSYGTLGKIYPGDKFMIISKSNGWANLKHKNSSGNITTGYASLSYIKEV